MIGVSMPEKIVFILSTSRTGTKSLAEGLAGHDIVSPHQPPFSRLLTVASNYYLHGWLPEHALEWLVLHVREPQIFRSNCRYYMQVYSLDYMAAKIISDKYPNVYIIHIVRDPRTFVPSYMNWLRTRYKSYLANKIVYGWHPSGFFTGEMPWRKWRKMDQFQRICWHWSYKNMLLERLFEGCEHYIQVRFEDLFCEKGMGVLRSVFSLMRVPYRDDFTALLGQRKNRSPRTRFPTWDGLPSYRKQQLLAICGPQMGHYGYLPGDRDAGVYSDDVVSPL